MSLEADREQLFSTIRQLERRRDKLKREYSQKKTKAMQDRLRAIALLIHDARLSPLQYRIMIMRYIKGMPWKVIYRALKKTKGYVLTQHRQALDKVARCGK